MPKTDHSPGLSGRLEAGKKIARPYRPSCPHRRVCIGLFSSTVKAEVPQPQERESARPMKARPVCCEHQAEFECCGAGIRAAIRRPRRAAGPFLGDTTRLSRDSRYRL